MIDLGIIGAGIMGERLLRAAQDHGAVTVVAAWDPAPATVSRLQAEFPAIRFLPSASDVIAASDCVCIASPPATHLSHARAAFAAGKAVFCEKLLAVDLEDAGRFIQQAVNQRTAVNFPFASSLAVAQLGRWLDDGVIGSPESVGIAVGFATWPRGWQHAAASWLDGPQQGGFTREVVSHFLFLARRLFGPVNVLQANAHFADPARSETSITARLRAGALPVTLTGAVGGTTEDDANSFTITGTAGAIRLRNWSTAECRDAAGQWAPDPAAVSHERARPLVLQRQLENVERMSKGQPHTLATVQEAYEVQTVVEAILRAR